MGELEPHRHQIDTRSPLVVIDRIAENAQPHRPAKHSSLIGEI